MKNALAGMAFFAKKMGSHAWMGLRKRTPKLLLRVASPAGPLTSFPSNDYNTANGITDT
jgi:hypothetical protein